MSITIYNLELSEVRTKNYYIFKESLNVIKSFNFLLNYSIKFMITIFSAL